MIILKISLSKKNNLYYIINDNIASFIDERVGIFFYPIPFEEIEKTIEQVDSSYENKGIVKLPRLESLEEFEILLKLVLSDLDYLPVELIRSTVWYYGVFSLETYILSQLLLREQDYYLHDIQERVKWYNITVKTNVTIESEGKEEHLRVISNGPLIKWYSRTNNIRPTFITTCSDYDQYSYSDRSRLIKELECNN